MQDPINKEASPGLQAGRLEGISVPDLLWAFCTRKSTGSLKITRGGVTKTVYFEDGRVVFAASSDPDDRLGELLLREKMITLRHLEEVLTRLNSGKRIGTLLVDAGYLQPDDLINGVLLQVRNIIVDLFTWETGDYLFNEGPLATVEVITLGTHTGDIILQGVRKIRSFQMIRRGVGSSRAWYRLSPSHQEILDCLNLSEGERSLLAELETEGASVEGLCRQVFLSNFEIYQALWAFKVLGIVQETDCLGAEVSEVSIEGRFGRETVAPLLARLCHNEETGVLHLTRGSLERTIHIREGLCTFATSNSPDDGLMTYLLRRGVISLKDREETARRLLSNKRVGTILREMGVIDDEDLQEVVREHLQEIVYDCLSWDGGEFSFVAGELPTVEEITLDEPVEELIARGMERVGSWSRVREGLGGLDLILQLAPDFLETLDRMTIGPVEWEVISCLKEPATALEVCSRLELGDFRVCQILWTLRVLGAVFPAPENELTEEPDEFLEVATDPAPEPAEVDFQEEEEFEDEDARVTEDLVAALEGSMPPVEEFSGQEEPEPFDPNETMAISQAMVEEALAAGPDMGDEKAEPAGPSEEETTQRLSREEVESVLLTEPEPEPELEAGPEPVQVSEAREETPQDDLPWVPPEDLERQISMFNAGQRVVYRTIRAEVGAGAANFVRSCCGQGEQTADLFESAELQTDGTWEVDGLRRAVLEKRVSDPGQRYRELLEREMELLKVHIGEARIASLREQVHALLQVEA